MDGPANRSNEEKPIPFRRTDSGEALRDSTFEQAWPASTTAFYKGEQGTTKNGKPRMVALGESVQKDLALWHQFRVGPDSYIFASEAGTPIKYENLGQRYIRPRASRRST